VRDRSTWLLLGLLAAVAVVLILAQNGTQQDSPEHSSKSDGPNGTSALVLYAAALGHPTRTIDFSFGLPDPPATLFVFNPSAHFSASDTSTLVNWVQGGGTLVYADDRLDTRLAVAFDLHKSRAVPANGRAATPALAGVNFITDNSFAEPLIPTANQAVLVAFSEDRALAVEEKIGQGRVIALAVPEVLCNSYLETADNGRFAADLVNLSPGPVAFDEYHHGDLAGAAGDWTKQPLGVALTWAAIAIFFGLLLRGRAFGPRLPPAGAGSRSAAEYAAAVGHLLRQAGGRALALKVVSEATRRALAHQLGLGGGVPLKQLDEVLARRAPAVAEQYANAAAEAERAGRSEPALLAAARRLHDLAYPMARK